MRADRAALRALAIACLLPVLGCTASLAPRGWLPTATEARSEAYGGWVQLTVGQGAAADTVSGELLAVSDDSVYTLRGRQVSVTALAAVTAGQLEYYDPGTDVLAVATLAGTFSTLTHGLALIVSAPAWVLVGSASTAALSGDGKLDLDPSRPRDQATARPGATREQRASWRDLRLHARFPGGWPPGLDRTVLNERPLHERPGGGRRQHGISRY